MPASTTSAVIVHLAGPRDVVELLELTDRQLDGWACVRCGADQTPGLPFVVTGWVTRRGQVFQCAAH